MNYFIGEIPMGLVYAVLAMGIFISLRVLNVPDLTTEGSFGIGAILGGVVGASFGAFWSLPAAMLAGVCAGLLTGFMQTKLRIHPVLSGIITLNMLYSVNLYTIHAATEKIAGVKNTNLNFGKNTIFRIIMDKLSIAPNSVVGSAFKMAILCTVLAILLILLVWFFSTNTGLAIRATGNNPDMVRASSINVDRMKMMSLCISNGLVALSGAMCAQLGGYTDFGLGNGTLIRGLAAVVLGGAIIKGSRIVTGLLASVLGALLYQILVAFVVRYKLFGADSSDMKSITIAAVMAFVLALPAIRSYLNGKRDHRQKRGQKDA